MLSQAQGRFLAARRVVHLATADARGVPHVAPVCFAIANRTLYITIDEKPKRRSGRPLKRLRNIAENPAVALVADRYDEDWTRLGWIMLQGKAELLSPGGAEHARAQLLLRERYRQLHAMHIEISSRYCRTRGTCDQLGRSLRGGACRICGVGQSSGRRRSRPMT